MAIRIKLSKTGSFRQGASVVLGRTVYWLCPVAALAAYLVVRSWSVGSLFGFESGAPLSLSLGNICARGSPAGRRSRGLLLRPQFPHRGGKHGGLPSFSYRAVRCLNVRSLESAKVNRRGYKRSDDERLDVGEMLQNVQRL